MSSDALQTAKTLVLNRNSAIRMDVAAMDSSLKRVIRQAIDDARAKGRDQLMQTQVAFEAVRQARPDLAPSDILAAITAL